MRACHLEDKTYEKLKEYSQKMGMSVNEILNILVVEAVNCDIYKQVIEANIKKEEPEDEWINILPTGKNN